MKKTVRVLLILLFAAVFLFSGWQLLKTLNTYREGREAYDALERHVSPGAASEAETPAGPPEELELEVSAKPERPDLSGWPQVDFEALSKINPDIVGWICIEGTNINYPVVQGTDNDYYLTHLFDGTDNSSGCIFLDYRCSADFSDWHSIVYGHHRKDNRMFSGLMAYKEQEFYDEHPVVLLVTPAAYYRIQLFSGYVTDDSVNAWELSREDLDVAVWLRELQARSCFASDHLPEETDRIVTLSTCTYEFANAKFLVHGYIAETIQIAE